ncbi:hypothetical protein ASF03_05495 [Rhizobium sp. Leaf68]|nr:hypothetical protein ASE62_05385 [Rhizobium sp. Leaf202]KQN85161.1 hypothetical protein ASF03_05495 [Rhizobium sp. Leaf68]
MVLKPFSGELFLCLWRLGPRTSVSVALRGLPPLGVILGLDPRIYGVALIHPSAFEALAWILGSSPRMTAEQLGAVGQP